MTAENRVDITTTLIPQEAFHGPRRLRQTETAPKLVYIKDLLVYLMYSAGIRVYMLEDISGTSPIYKLMLKSLDANEGIMHTDPRLMSIDRNELQAWRAGINALLGWLGNYRSVDCRTLYPDALAIHIFGNFASGRISRLENALSSHLAASPSNSRKNFSFENVDNVNPKFAAKLIEYLKFMLVSPVIQPVAAEPIPSNNPSLEGFEGIIPAINRITREMDSEYRRTDPVEQILANNPHMREEFDEALRLDAHARGMVFDGRITNERAPHITEMSERYPPNIETNEPTTGPNQE